MNLKPNLWTLLFALTILFLLYLSLDNKAKKKNDKIGGNTLQQNVIDLSDTIPENIAIERWAKYWSEVTFQRNVDSTNTAMGVVNSNATMFKMKKGELQQMISYLNGEDVVAYLTIKNGISPAKDTIDLIFSDGDLFTSGSFLSDGSFQLDQNLSKKERTLYFDFSMPCPPLCQDAELGN
ncbi:MAG: hypothetical protein R2825_10435 [Saprospiraceae bacterium]